MEITVSIECMLWKSKGLLSTIVLINQKLSSSQVRLGKHLIICWLINFVKNSVDLDFREKKLNNEALCTNCFGFSSRKVWNHSQAHTVHHLSFIWRELSDSVFTPELWLDDSTSHHGMKSGRYKVDLNRLPLCLEIRFLARRDSDRGKCSASWF